MLAEEMIVQQQQKTGARHTEFSRVPPNVSKKTVYQTIISQLA